MGVVKTYPEAQEIKYLIATNIDSRVNDKLTYAAKRLVENIDNACKAIEAKHREKISDLQAVNALTDKISGALLTESTPQGDKYLFSPEGKKTLMAAIRKEEKTLELVTVEFEPFLSPSCPRIEDVSLNVIEKLSGILFPEELFTKLYND